MSDQVLVSQAISAIDPSDPLLLTINDLQSQLLAYDVAKTDLLSQVAVLQAQIQALYDVYNTDNPPEVRSSIEQQYQNAVTLLQQNTASTVATLTSQAISAGTILADAPTG